MTVPWFYMWLSFNDFGFMKTKQTQNEQLGQAAHKIYHLFQPIAIFILSWIIPLEIHMSYFAFAD